MWRIVYLIKKLDPQSLSLLEKILDDISYTCGTTFDEFDLPATLKSVCVRTLHCNDPMEKLYYSCSFLAICYYCGKEILIEEVSPEVYPVCKDGIEFQLEEDESLTISTIQVQFGPYSNGLFYYNPDSGRKRGIDRS